MDSYSCKSPVLFLVFNRPNVTKRVFEAIRHARPPRLYVAADGARKGRGDEGRLVEETRRVATSVDWDCEVKTLFREENLGCGKAVSEAITWFFNQEEMGIILEDDCLPGATWFRFADEMLKKYEDDQRIMSVTALNLFPEKFRVKSDYFFSRYSHCWGWACWRRAWVHYDYDISSWPIMKLCDWLDAVGSGSVLFNKLWSRKFNLIHDHSLDTWDYQWFYSCWIQSGLTVTPKSNLIQNLGFNENGVHTTVKPKFFRNEINDIHFPMIKNGHVFVNYRYDRAVERRFHKHNLIAYIKSYLIRIKLIRFVWDNVIRR